MTVLVPERLTGGSRGILKSLSTPLRESPKVISWNCSTLHTERFLTRKGAETTSDSAGCSYRKDTCRTSHNYTFIFLKRVSKFTLLMYHLRLGFFYHAITAVVLGKKAFLKLNFKSCASLYKYM